MKDDKVGRTYIVENISVCHPWKLICYRIFYFPILRIIYKFAICDNAKTKYKSKLFYERFAKFARDKFKTDFVNKNTNVYDVGPFKICITNNCEQFSIKNLEWNLAYEYFDIIYPTFNHNLLNLFFGEGPYENKNVFCEKNDYVIDAGASLGTFTFLSSMRVGSKGHVFAIEPLNFFIGCLKKSEKSILQKM